ncbi:histidine phosphatase family protein [Inquilinus limosus]|uniref:histidine phosphatase family protein n=1 Tax=Inquilinus limosus TaxID=171674 RepID=UPI003F1634DD
MSTTRWWWIRHAPVANPDKLLYGRLDLPADTADAAAIAALAARLPHGAVWLRTPLRRTGDTAAALLAAMGEAASPTIETELIEQDFGTWQGRPSREVYGALPPDDPFWSDPAGHAPPGGESFDAMLRRVQPAIRRLSETHAGRDVVAVAHAGTIRAAAALALDLDGDRALRLAIDMLSLTRIDRIRSSVGAEAWRVVALNLPFGTEKMY